MHFLVKLSFMFLLNTFVKLCSVYFASLAFPHSLFFIFYMLGFALRVVLLVCAQFCATIVIYRLAIGVILAESYNRINNNME